MNQWNTIATQESIDKTVQSLAKNGITAIVVATAEEAKQKATELIPQGAEVMTMTSVTLDSSGMSDLFNSEAYNAVKPKLYSLDRETQGLEMNKMGAAPEWVIGSVHAVTEDGRVVIASNTGSQLPAYSYGSQHVVWVVGAQKIVKHIDAAMKRVEEYVLPLESERARKAYGTDGSNISKMLIVNKEVNPKRITMIIVKESLGY